MNVHLVQMTINGEPHSIEVGANVALLDALRDHCGLTGAKECCAVGECGACTVEVDGRTVNACLVLAVEADGSDIVTIEGLAPPGELSPVQQAFLDCGAVQCGFCIPGMVMSARRVLEQDEPPGIDEVREGLAGNLCRCAGYNRMFEAVLAVGAGEYDRRDADAGSLGDARGQRVVGVADAVAHGPAEDRA